jgi:hypothetical protein
MHGRWTLKALMSKESRVRGGKRKTICGLMSWEKGVIRACDTYRTAGFHEMDWLYGKAYELISRDCPRKGNRTAVGE